jgi:deoxyribonuclease V
MDVSQLHPWDLTPRQAVEVQRELAPLVLREGDVAHVRMVAGSDIALGPRWTNAPGRAAVVVLDFPGLQVLHTAIADGAITFPYIPGLLAFREIPLLVEAFRSLPYRPDLLLVDGQGIAHPRRFGIASHLGLLLDIPTIGCAKSRLTGSHDPVPAAAGSWTPLLDGGETIGAVVRTRENVRPLYVSVGHKIGLEAAVRWVLACTRGRRLPEPTRLADQLASMRSGTKTGR